MNSFYIIKATSNEDKKETNLEGVVVKLRLIRREAGLELVTLHFTTCST